jgi:hypothetical protein
LGCAFSLWTTSTWSPGETIEWEPIAGPKQPGIESPTVTVVTVRWFIPQLLSVRKLYVEPLQGNRGEQNRDRIIALLANRPRFQVVDTQEMADATIRGRTESVETGTTVTTAENTRAGAVVGGIPTLAAGSARSSTNTSQTTRPIVSESVLLRVTLRSGETIWAWDDTKSCNEPKPKCALDDLIGVAGN